MRRHCSGIGLVGLRGEGRHGAASKRLSVLPRIGSFEPVTWREEQWRRKSEAFLDRMTAAQTVSAALGAMRDHYGLTNVTYHLARTIAGDVDSPFVRTTYPDPWVARYLLEGYVRIDPIVREGFARSVPFDWTDVETLSSDLAFLDDAARHGIGGRGYSIPITDRAGRRALLSVNSQMSKPGWKHLTAQFAKEWLDLGQLVHKIAIAELYGGDDPVPTLAAREIECLHWTALGKDHKDIALILNLSEHTVRDYTKSARLKLGCATLSAAVMRAAHLRIISPWPSPPSK